MSAHDYTLATTGTWLDALPTVVSVTPSIATVTDNNVGTPEDPGAGFALRITFDQAMDTNTSPSLTFSPDVAATLTYDADWSWWVSSTTFVARFDVADADAIVSSVGVGVSAAQSGDGIVQAPYAARTTSPSTHTMCPRPARRSPRRERPRWPR